MKFSPTCDGVYHPLDVAYTAPVAFPCNCYSMVIAFLPTLDGLWEPHAHRLILHWVICMCLAEVFSLCGQCSQVRSVFSDANALVFSGTRYDLAILTAGQATCHVASQMAFREVIDIAGAYQPPHKARMQGLFPFVIV